MSSTVPRRTLELLDTSVLLNLLRVPFESDHADDVQAELDAKWKRGVEFRLPLAALIEAGDHVGRVDNGTKRRQCAVRLRKLIEATLDGTAPWSFAPLEWDATFLKQVISMPSAELVDSLAAKRLEMGDLVILAELRRLRSNLDQKVIRVVIWTLDEQLRSAAELP